MKDAFGGIINMFFVAIFLLITIGILGLVVSYTKAFKMKNIVISHIENFEASGCFTEGTACMKKIRESAEGIGYGSRISCPSGFNKIDGLFCYKEIQSTNRDNYYSNNPVSYRIMTQVDLDLPIISTIFSMSFFRVVGDTRVIDRQA